MFLFKNKMHKKQVNPNILFKSYKKQFASTFELYLNNSKTKL